MSACNKWTDIVPQTYAHRPTLSISACKGWMDIVSQTHVHTPLTSACHRWTNIVSQTHAHTPSISACNCDWETGTGTLGAVELGLGNWRLFKWDYRKLGPVKLGTV